MKYFYVYRITCLDNDKSYIGISIDMESRVRQHIRTAHGDKKRVPILYRAMRKYGTHRFSFEHIASAMGHENAYAVEKALIAQDGTFKPSGYNSTLGGDGTHGQVFSEEALEKIRTGFKGRTHTPESREKMRSFLGRNHTAETRAKMSASGMGRHAPSDETRERMRLGQLNKADPEGWKEKLRKANLGKKASEETRAKMSLASKGRPKSDSAKENMRISAKMRQHRIKSEKMTMIGWA